MSTTIDKHLHDAKCTHKPLELINEKPIDYSADGLFGYGKIQLTTYTEDPEVKPIPLAWGHSNPLSRGPITPSRYGNGMYKHNAIGAHAGPYSIYHALAVGSKQLKLNHKADYTNAQPPVDFPQQPQWSGLEKIVAMDPFGHLAPWLFSDVSEKEGVEIRPTISITKANLQLTELKEEVAKGNLKVDGEVCVNSNGDLHITKLAVDPVWYLPGVAKRFGISEGKIGRAHV